ncbi:MAG: metallophosphoesterase [Candidatus Nanoarchaeia archaeon]
MKILAFTDIHVSNWAIKALKEKVKKHKPDLAINCGDFSIFDEGTEQVLKKLDKLGIPIITLHGNHETDTIVEYWCKKSKNLLYMHEEVKEIYGITFIAWGGGGFSRKEKGFENFIKSINMRSIKKPIILLTHAPPGKTKIDVVPYIGHVGCNSFTTFIKKQTKKIVLALSGHIHDTFYTDEKIKESTIMNPGPTGTLIDINPNTGKIKYKFEKLRDIPEMY